jgi:hypothetical protein
MHLPDGQTFDTRTISQSRSSHRSANNHLVPIDPNQQDDSVGKPAAKKRDRSVMQAINSFPNHFDKSAYNIGLQSLARPEPQRSGSESRTPSAASLAPPLTSASGASTSFSIGSSDSSSFGAFGSVPPPRPHSAPTFPTPARGSMHSPDAFGLTSSLMPPTLSEEVKNNLLQYSIHEAGHFQVFDNDPEVQVVADPNAQRRVLHILDNDDMALALIEQALQYKPNASIEVIAKYYNQFL